MSSTRLRGGAQGAPLKGLLSNDRLIVAGALAAAAALAWAWLLNAPMGKGEGMAGMAMQPSPLSAAYLFPTFAMWTIMMVAMMIPSAAPMILLHARIDKSPSASALIAHNLVFASAYLLVWAAFSALAAFAQAIFIHVGAVSGTNLALGSPAAAAALMIAAAAYELTAAKTACLETCQSPLYFLLKHFRPGTAGALRLGILHGAYCLGCCWALMLLLFVGGVMNLAWVAFLGILVLGEKLAPPRWRANRFVAAGLAAGAAVLLIR